MKLRPYQENTVNRARESLKRNRAIIVQEATGTGKTHEMAAMCHGALGKNKRAWIVVPRTELLSQAKDKLKKYRIPHGIIDPRHNESLAYKIHVVSKDTLIRRYDNIKNAPDLILWDEAHIALDQQIEAYKRFEKTRFIGMTATPERGDGRGLSIQAGGIYDDLILGESIPWMIEHDYLTQYKYFAPTLKGLDELHKQGTDYKADEFDALLKRNKVYGQAIEHYGDLAQGKPALGFCRDVKSAYETADRFSKYWKFHCIEGKMRKGQRKAMIDALTNGEIDGLFNCEIATYGLDIPRVEVGIQLRYTASKSLQFQMLGRILRPFENQQTGYMKNYAVYIDHVNNWEEFIDPEFTEMLPFNLPNQNWNFHGIEKRKWSKKEYEKRLVVCPSCWQHTTGLLKCHICGAELKRRKQQKIELIDTKLQEIKQVKLKDLPLEEKRETNDKINELIELFEIDYQLGKMNPGAVGEMIKLAEKLGNSIMWVYHQFCNGNVMVNISLLQEIARQKKFKNGWVWHKKKSLKGIIEDNRKQMENYEESLIG